jgi:hypothetical protein
MNKLIIILLTLMPVISQANPDNLSSGTRDIAKDKSKSESHSEKVGRAAQSANSQSAELNVNSVMLREFIRRYEQKPFTGGTRSQYIFSECKPLTGIINEYPTLNSTPSVNGRGGIVFEPNNIVPRRMARHFEAGAGSSTGVVQGATLGNPSSTGVNSDLSKTGMQSNYDMPAQNQEVGRYARCRIIASWWIDQAAQRATSESARSEREVVERIQQVFDEMDKDSELFENYVNNAIDLWKSAECSATLKRWPDFNKPELICYGTLVIEGNNIEVENQPTLSASSIAGRSYKIAIQSSNSNSVAVEDSVGSEKRQSASERQSGTVVIKQKSKAIR